MVVWEHTNADFSCFCFNWNVQRYAMGLSWALYCQKNTRKSCLFSPPNTVWPAERRKTAIFADFRRFWPKDTTITPKQARNRHCTSILHRQRYYRGNSWDLLNLPTPPISCLFLVFSCLFLVFSCLFFSWKAEEKYKKRKRKGKEKPEKSRRKDQEKKSAAPPSRSRSASHKTRVLWQNIIISFNYIV